MKYALPLLLLAAVAASCSGGDSDSTPTPAATATATQPATAVPEPSPTPTVPVPRHIVLDTSPQEQPPETTRSLPPAPQASFPLWNGTSTVIYDRFTSQDRDLGPGAQPASFSPDSKKAAWAAGDQFAGGTEIFVVDLPDGQPRSLGPGRIAQFVDNDSLVVFAVGSNERAIVDVATGARRPYAEETIPSTMLVPPPRASEGFIIEPDNPSRVSQVQTHTVRDAKSGAVLLTFEAIAVVGAGPGEVAAAAPFVDGHSNVFIIDVVSGKQTFVATARPDIVNWPLSATADAVLWTDGYCILPPGTPTLFDRKSGQLVRFDTSASPGTDRWMLLTPDGLLAAGSFGATALIDPATGNFVTVIPGRTDAWAGDVSWSPDYRYASHGPYGGHGGIC